MARTRSIIIISLAAALAVVTAVVFAGRISSSGWGTISRLLRSEDDHPHWELLAQ
ncbi:MAG: hypothetical protein WEC79_02190 [Thermomicrobiales bacterium]